MVFVLIALGVNKVKSKLQKKAFKIELETVFRDLSEPGDAKNFLQGSVMSQLVHVRDGFKSLLQQDFHRKSTFNKKVIEVAKEVFSVATVAFLCVSCVTGFIGAFLVLPFALWTASNLNVVSFSVTRFLLSFFYKIT